MKTFALKIGSIQGQNLALTGLFVPTSRDSGRGFHLADFVVPHIDVKDANEGEDRGYRENLAHIREPRPDSGLGLQVQILKTFKLPPLRSTAVPGGLCCPAR